MSSEIEKQKESEVKQKAREEGWKLHYDTYKHLTTLSTGSILILVAFLEKVFTNPIGKRTAAAAFFLFVVSIITSVMMMFGIATTVREQEKLRVYDRLYDIIASFISVASFVGGVISLIIFALINFN